MEIRCEMLYLFSCFCWRNDRLLQIFGGGGDQEPVCRGLL